MIGGKSQSIRSWLWLLVLVWLPLSEVFAQGEVTDHQLEITLTADGKQIQIKDSIRPARSGSYRFELASWLTIDSAKLGSTPLQLSPDNRRYQVDIPPGSRDRLELELSGILPDLQEGSGFGVDQQSVYLPPSASWFPHDILTAAAWHATLSMPDSLQGYLTGRFLNESVTNKVIRRQFVSETHGHLPVLIAGPYRVALKRVDGINLRTWFYADQQHLAQGYLDDAEKYLAHFSQLIGDYPFSEFDMIAAPLPVGLGFPGMTYLSRDILEYPFVRMRSLAHEVLHNWWGNGVLVDYHNGNWAEGLTTYLSDYDLSPSDHAKTAMRLKWLRDLAALPAERDYPANRFIARRHQATQVIGYNKVAYLFHMLRQILGPDLFAEGLKIFWKGHKGSIAGWSDIQDVFERVANRDFKPFFDQWLTRTGLPTISLGSHRVVEQGDGFTTSLQIRQGSPAYSLNLEIEVKSGDQQFIRQVSFDEEVGEFFLTSDHPPDSIRIDPDYHQLRKLVASETPVIFRDITLNPQTRVVLHSAQPEFRQVGLTLAERLMDSDVNRVDGMDARTGGSPRLILTDTQAGYQQFDLVRPPEIDRESRSVRVWTTRDVDANPVMVVEARNADALAAITRGLPHYGSRSFVLFDGGNAMEKGVWEIRQNSLFRCLVQHCP